MHFYHINDVTIIAEVHSYTKRCNASKVVGSKVAQIVTWELCGYCGIVTKMTVLLTGRNGWDGVLAVPVQRHRFPG
jgi:hypothetical protein